MKNYLTILTYIALMFLNILFSGYPILGTILTFVQITIVIILIIKLDFRRAFLCHLIFLITSINFIFYQGAENNLEVSYNYSKLRLFDITPISFLISILFFIIYSYNKSNKNYFSTFSFQYSILNAVAILFGIFGMFFFDYSKLYFQTYLYYGLNIFKNWQGDSLYVFLKNNIFYLLIASPICSVIIFILGFSTTYGGISIIPFNSLFLFTPFLLVVKKEKNKILLSSALISFFFISIYSIGGKGVAFLALILILIFINSLFVKKKYIYSVIIIMILFIGSSLYTILSNSDSKNDYLITHKVEQFFSIFSLNSSLSESIEDVSASPRIRIAEIFNIIELYRQKPYLSLFGLGYGGYFEDYLGLFLFIDLSQGAFDDEQISKGRFYRPHDTYPVILLLHGIMGIFFVLYWSFYSLLNYFKTNYLIGIIPWLFLTYGFDTNIAFIGIIFLYIGLYELFYINKSNLF